MTRCLPLLFVLLLSAAACASPERPLPEGTWTGGLVPMNHPEMHSPIAYLVRYQGDDLVLSLTGPDGSGGTMATRSVRLAQDTLYFAFDEPEQNMPLRCALGRQPDGSFVGRCTDPSGKWARFSMIPPDGA